MAIVYNHYHPFTMLLKPNKDCANENKGKLAEALLR